MIHLLRRPIRIRWRMFALTAAFSFVAYMQRTSLSVAAEQIMPRLHISQMQMGLVLWAFTVTYTLFQIPAGLFGQRCGARRTYFWVGLVGFVATMVIPLVPVVLSGFAVLLALVLAQGVLGISQAPVFPVFAGVVESWFPSRRWALASGLQTSGTLIGAAVTPPLIVLLTGSFGWQEALVIYAFPSLALAILWAWYARDLPHEHSAVTKEELAELDEGALESVAPLTIRRLAQIVSGRNVLLLAFSYMCMNYVFYLLTTWSFLYLIQERHFSVLESGMLASLPPIGATVGAALGGVLADRLARRLGIWRGYRLVPLVALPMVGVLLVAVIHVASPYLAAAALTGAFAAVEVTEATYWAATMHVARTDTMAATGVLNTGGNLGGVVGIPIVAYLSSSGSWNAAFLTGAVFAIVAAAAWLVMVSPDSHPSADVHCAQFPEAIP